MKYDPSRDIWAPMSIAEVKSLFSGCSARWWLSGGWAIDHWLGTITRAHGDIDLSTLRDDLPSLLQRLPDHFEPFAAMSGHLFPFPSHAEDPDLHNIWVRHRESGRWVLQINIEEGDSVSWRYRRAPQISTSWNFAVQIVEGVPTGAPATQLLWKSPDPRPQDDADLTVALLRLSEPERRWLAQAVHAAHPFSPWAADARLSGP